MALGKGLAMALAFQYSGIKQRKGCCVATCLHNCIARSLQITAVN